MAACGSTWSRWPPEVSGQVVSLPVNDNQFVHKGDLLMTIDPRDYAIAVKLAEASVAQSKADAGNKRSQAQRRLSLTDLATTPEEKETYVTSADAAGRRCTSSSSPTSTRPS